MAKGGLGSGFDFLYDENAADVQVKKTLRLSDMEPNRQQPLQRLRIPFDSMACYSQFWYDPIREPTKLLPESGAGVPRECWDWMKFRLSSRKFPMERQWKLP